MTLPQIEIQMCVFMCKGISIKFKVQAYLNENDKKVSIKMCYNMDTCRLLHGVRIFFNKEKYFYVSHCTE